mgnify:CR=1 FL=1
MQTKTKRLTESAMLIAMAVVLELVGKMVIPELKNGVIDDCLYINDVKQLAYQLVEFEGDFYFINDGAHRIAKNTKLYLSETFVEGKTFADGRAIQPGTYQFDAEGKAYVSFYTSDSASDLRIEIEGKSAAKQYHYVEKIIPRKK